MAEPELHEIAWALTRVADGQIVGKYSRRHWYLGDGDGEPLTTPLGPERTLCGKLIPWVRVHGSNEGDCAMCLRVMRARRPEGSEPILRAHYITDAVVGVIESNPRPPEGAPFYATASTAGELTEEDFIRQAESVLDTPRAGR